jgi:leader peptidase (prepilin peptidase)/N-methyltransferase
MDSIHFHVVTLEGDDARLACWFMTAWLGVFGAVFGSFLNVVIYRLPLGMSLSFPGSRCPVCKHPIRWYDNVPVLGWLWLKGRCRDCRTSISPRYPLVELLVGLLFAGLAWLEVFQLGINLPERIPPSAAEPSSILWLQYAFHLMLACTVLCAGLMEYDGQPTPRRLWLPALLLGLALPVVWPELRPVPFMRPLPALLLDARVLAGLMDGLAGLAAGAGLGWLMQGNRRRIAAARPAKASKPASGSKPASSGGSDVPTLAVIGSFLGWQAICWVVIGGGLLYGLAVGLSRFGFARRIGFVGCASLATLALLPAWRLIDTMQSRSGLPESLLPGLVAALVAAGSRWLSRSSAPTKNR